MLNPMNSRYRLRSCARCGGDAYLDGEDELEWRCIQCARPVSGVVPARARETAWSLSTELLLSQWTEAA